MRFSEFKEDKGSNLASRVIRNYARELGADSMDYGMFIKSADLLDKDMLKSLALHIEKSDTAPREYVMKKIADHNPEIFKKMYGDQEGYLSLMKPQKDLTDGEDNTDRGMNKYGLAARHKDGKFHSYRHGKHTGSFDSPGELAKHQQDLIKDESVTNEDQTTMDVKAILDRHGVKSTYDIEYGGEAFSDLFAYFSSDPDEMPYGVQKARTGMPDEWIANRILDLGLLKEVEPQMNPEPNRPQPTTPQRGPDDTRLKTNVSLQQIANLFPGIEDKQTFLQSLLRLKQGQKISMQHAYTLANAFKELISKDPQDTQRAMIQLKKIGAQESINETKEDDAPGYPHQYKTMNQGKTPEEALQDERIEDSKELERIQMLAGLFHSEKE